MRQMAVLSVLAIVVLTGCAASPPTPCQRDCSRFYDACMDVSASLSNPQAVRAVERQCATSQQSCVKACERSCDRP